MNAQVITICATDAQMEELQRQARELNESVLVVAHLAIAEFCRRCRQIREEERAHAWKEETCKA